MYLKRTSSVTWMGETSLRCLWWNRFRIGSTISIVDIRIRFTSSAQFFFFFKVGGISFTREFLHDDICQQYNNQVFIYIWPFYVSWTRWKRFIYFLFPLVVAEGTLPPLKESSNIQYMLCVCVFLYPMVVKIKEEEPPLRVRNTFFPS
jgi:hypothetical protein